MGERMQFWEHVEELRKALLRSCAVIAIATIATFILHDKFFGLLLRALSDQPLYVFAPAEGLTLVLKLSVLGGVLLAAPLWGYFLLQFVIPGMRARERRLLLPFIALSCLFMGAGIAFAYLVTLPLVTQFFRAFNTSLGENMWGAGQTVSFALTLILAHGIVFELYVGLGFLLHFGILKAEQLAKGRRVMIVATLVLAAILTPPDLLSQLLLAAPMLLLFEGAILYGHLRKKAFNHA